MDSYIVRIYRRNLTDPSKMAGVVEYAGTVDQKVFHTQEELLTILSKKETGHKVNPKVTKKSKKGT